jgi:hypothetical protein
MTRTIMATAGAGLLAGGGEWKQTGVQAVANE